MADTGNSSTLTLSGGFTAAYVMIGGSEETIDALEDSDLSTVGKKTYVPSDLSEPGQFDAEFFYNPNEQPPLGTVQTITKTYPVPPGLSNGATESGTGFLIARSTPELVNGALMKAKMTVKWDGKTGPTFADAT